MEATMRALSPSRSCTLGSASAAMRRCTTACRRVHAGALTPGTTTTTTTTIAPGARPSAQRLVRACSGSAGGRAGSWQRRWPCSRRRRSRARSRRPTAAALSARAAASPPPP
eukprot:scaffold87034_cov35-Phaeocystis_antarctica.AAC.1